MVEAIERGWDRLTNGELIAAAEAAGFELLLTPTRTSGISKTLKAEESRLWLLPINNGPRCAATLTGLWSLSMQPPPGSYTEVEIPFQ